MKKKYLFFYLNTGGGHLAPAKAVAEQIVNNSQDIEVILQDGFEKASKMFSSFIVDGYKTLQTYSPKLYEILYALNKNKIFTKNTIDNIHSIIKYDILEMIDYFNPDKIVIFHSFLIKPVIKAVEKLGLKIPVIVAVTDPITPPPIWFVHKNIDFIVFSKGAYDYAIEKGIDKNRLTILNFPLASKFSKPMSEKQVIEFKKQKDLPLDKPIILVLGGADGIPKGRKIIKRLVEAEIDAQIIIVCGRNQVLYNKCLKFKENNNIDNLIVLGYIDFVYELMNSSDIVISKCGASTFMEILLSQKIPIINSYLWEQEKGNVEFIVDNDLGFYEKSTKKIAKIVKKLLEKPDLMDELKHNIKSMKLKNGNTEIANFIINNTSIYEYSSNK